MLGSMPGKAADVEAAATRRFLQAANSGVSVGASTLMLDTLVKFLCFEESSGNCKGVGAGAGPTVWKLAK